MSKLTGHSQGRNLTGAVTIASQHQYWVCIDPPADSAAMLQSAGVRLVARRYSSRYDFGPGQYEGDPHEAAAEFLSDCMAQSWWEAAWAIMSPPAMGGFWNEDGRAWCTSFMAALVRLCNKPVFVCNVPSGQQGWEVPGAQYYACQEYQEGQLLYREWFPAILHKHPQAKLLVAECGYTNLERRPPQHPTGDAPHGEDIGWQGGYGVDPEPYYMAWMDHYRANLEQDEYVVAAALYGVGMDEDWASFEHLGTDAEQLLKDT